MKNTTARLALIAPVLLVALSLRAQAVCIDPKTFVSGYKIMLANEIESTPQIIIGEVTKERPLLEDVSDPTGVTATEYSVQVIKTLKGTVFNNILLRTQNDSGRYLMAIGQRHLLFLTKDGEVFRVDSCGNSSLLPDGTTILKQTEVLLKERH